MSERDKIQEIQEWLNLYSKAYYSSIENILDELKELISTYEEE